MLNPPEENGDFGLPKAAEKQVAYFLYFLVGLVIAGVWTLVGIGLAFAQGDFVKFVAEWQSLQAPFLIGLGTCLLLMAKSDALTERAARIAKERLLIPSKKRTWLRITIVGGIFVVGTASLVWMGFNATGHLLVFMWITAAAICFTAGVVTLHTIDLLVVMHSLQGAGVKAFRYSPARTPELRDLINYFTSFTLLLSIAYSFAFAGTIRGHWTGDPAYIEAVQLFWPLVYVPICSAALLYPHFVMHNLIRAAKEDSLVSYQREIDQLMIDYKGLNNEDISKINSLAQLFDRISATPDYVVDLGIAIRTCLPLAFNVAILFAKPILGQT
jgi:hypothetical protein